MNDKVRKKEIDQLAKSGDFDGLVAAVAGGIDVDLGQIFERAVTDYRTVKRKPGHLAILEWCLDEGLGVTRETVWLAARFSNNTLVDKMRERGLPDDPFVAASVGELEADEDVGGLRDESGLNLLHYCAGSGLGRNDPATKERLTRNCERLITCGVDTAHAVQLDVVHTPAFRCAASGGNADIMRMLLSHGEIEVAGLHQALEFTLEPHQRSGEPFGDVAEVILEHGFDINSIRPDQGRTLLHGSANRGSTTAVGWLLDHGADANARDVEGRTPIHVAAERNTHTSAIERLLDAGAEVGAVDKGGLCALEIAKANGRTKVVGFLSAT